MINFYNQELLRLKSLKSRNNNQKINIDDFVNNDLSKISWSGDLKTELSKLKEGVFDSENIVVSQYRPFVKKWLYFDRQFNNSVYQMSKIFPRNVKNLAIHITGVGARSGFSAIMINQLPDCQNQDNGQCFPYKIFEEDKDFIAQHGQNDLFSKKAFPNKKFKEVDGISDFSLRHFQELYEDKNISKEDIFYYVYGILHSLDYRQRFQDNLSKELPRIPFVKSQKDFNLFNQSGRKLAELHVNYDQAALYPVKIIIDKKENDAYKITKIKFIERNNLKKIRYNDNIIIEDIPEEAFDYIVSGKPALSWVIEKFRLDINPDANIENNPNDWAIETMNNPKYPLELFQRMITVSLETMKIVKALPKLDI